MYISLATCKSLNSNKITTTANEIPSIRSIKLSIKCNCCYCITQAALVVPRYILVQQNEILTMNKINKRTYELSCGKNVSL